MAEETENATPAGNPVPENVGEEMHDGLDASLPSELEEAAPHSPTEAKTYRLFGREKPVHQLLGGGKAADMLLWRNKKISATVLVGATAVWVLFTLLEYRFLTLVSHLLILLLSASFLWSNTTRTFVKKSLPQIPEVAVPEEPFLQAASAVTSGLNRCLAILRGVACGRDLRKFIAIVAGLWISSVVGRWCNILTLLYICFILLHTLPVLYEKYDHRVDSLTEKTMSEVSRRHSRLVATVKAKKISISMGGFKRKAV